MFPPHRTLCGSTPFIIRSLPWAITFGVYLLGGLNPFYQQQRTIRDNPLPRLPLLVTQVRVTPPDVPLPLVATTARNYNVRPIPEPSETLIWNLVHYPRSPRWAEMMVALNANLNTPIEELTGIEHLPEELKVLRGRTILQFVLALGYKYYDVARYLLGIPFLNDADARVFAHFPYRQFLLQGLGDELMNVPYNDPWGAGRWAGVLPLAMLLNPHCVAEVNEEGQRTGRFIRPQDAEQDQRNLLIEARNALLRDWIQDERFTEEVALRQDDRGNTILHYAVTAYLPPVELIGQLVKKFPRLLAVCNDNGFTALQLAAARGVNFQFERPLPASLPEDLTSYILDTEGDSSSGYLRKEK